MFGCLFNLLSPKLENLDETCTKTQISKIIVLTPLNLLLPNSDILYRIILNFGNIILTLAFATMTKSKLKYQDRIASQVLASFRYAMLSKLIFAQYSI